MKTLFVATLAFAVVGTAYGQVAEARAMPLMASAEVAANAAMTTANGEGEVKAVDAKAGTLTIHHGPIPTLGWPAMTMAFQADPKNILQNIKPGQKVSFKLMQMGGSITLTEIQAK